MTTSNELRDRALSAADDLLTDHAPTVTCQEATDVVRELLKELA